MLVATVAATPVLMAFWFATVLAAWNRIGAAQSLFYSFFAVLRNWRAFFVYGAVLAPAGGGFISSVAVTIKTTPGARGAGPHTQHTTHPPHTATQQYNTELPAALPQTANYID